MSKFVYDDHFNFNDPEFWREQYRSQSPWTGNVSYERSQFPITINVPWKSFPSALITILGFSQVRSLSEEEDEESPYTFHRFPPVRHPIFPNLCATSIQNIQGLGVPEFGLTGPWDPTLFDAPTQTSPGGPVIAGAIDLQPPYGVYKDVRMTVNFEPLPYGTAQDKEVGLESERYVSYEYVPGTEILGIEGTAWKFESGPGAASTTLSTTTGARFPLFSPRSTLKLTWHRVPWDWVANPFYDANNIFSVTNSAEPLITLPNIEYCIGKVNDRDFFGYKRGELLLDPPIIHRYAEPFPVFVERPTFFPFLLCDITFPFRIFNPDQGNDTIGVSSTTYSYPRGWQTAPWRGDFKFYPIVLSPLIGYPAVPSGTRPYREANMHELFERVDRDPSVTP